MISMLATATARSKLESASPSQHSRSTTTIASSSSSSSSSTTSTEEQGWLLAPSGCRHGSLLAAPSSVVERWGSMTDISSLTTHAEVQLNTLPAISSVPIPQPLYGAPPVGLTQEDEEEDYTIKCICGYIEDDGHTVYCDDCDTWQHVQCYYNNEKPPEVHRCVECDPRPVDTKRPLARSKQANGERKVKRPPTKSHKKKVKDIPPATGQTNGWSNPEKDDLTHAADRHSGSPRDQPPPAKRTKTTHRSAHSISANAPPSRKRAGSSANFARSPSKSPSGSPAINGWQQEYYSHDFMQLHRTGHGYTHTEANLHVNIDVTNNLSLWLTEPSALASATNGKAPHDVYQRWDKSMDELTSPEVKKHVDEDTSRTFYGAHPVWQYLTTESDVAKDSYIGELRGHIGHIEDYVKDPANRWSSLRHPAPFVFFHPQLPIYIDTRVEGTLLRYTRYSCRPNLAIKTLITEGNEYHFCLVALEDIPAGSEITVGWELEVKVRQLLSAARLASAQTSNGFRLEGRDEEYISRWVNNLLANFGDCACGSGLSCAIGRFDKRAFLSQLDGPAPEPSRPIRTKKHKRTGTQISPLNTGLATNSRSGSEAIKADQEENGDDSRSASSRSKHGSRDNTPMTHFSGDASGGFGTELSDREKRKLLQQEKLFEQLEHEEQHGSRKKKRNSGGSTLNTPSAATSRQLGHSEPSPSSVGTIFASGTRYVDTGIGDRDHSPLSHSMHSRRVTGPSRFNQNGGQTSPNPVPHDYTDASTQTDPLPHERLRPEVNMPRKYLPRTRRLLRNFTERRRRIAESVELVTSEMPLAGSPLRKELTPDAMDVESIGQPTEPTAMPPPAVPVPPPAISETSIERNQDQSAEGNFPGTNRDIEMLDANVADNVALKSEPETGTNPLAEAGVSEHQQLLQPPLQSSPPWPLNSESAPSSSSPSRNNFRSADLHVSLPPAPQFTAPPAQMTSTPSSGFAPPSLLSPMSVPASSSHSHTAPVFPTPAAVASTVAPSPAKKKMSLSDYTKRSKAREVERSSPPVTITDSVKEDTRGHGGAITTASAALQGSAVMDTPSVEKDEPELSKAPKIEEVQFVDFASKLISSANEIRRNGSTEDVEFLKAQTTDLIERNACLQESTHNAEDIIGDVDRTEKALVTAVVRCTKVSNELIALLIKLTPSSRSTFEGVRKSFRMLWKKEKVENLSKRLSDCRIELNSHVLVLINTRFRLLEKGQNDLASGQKKILEAVTFTKSRTAATNDTSSNSSQDQEVQETSAASENLALEYQPSNPDEGHLIGKATPQYQGEDIVAILFTHEDGTSKTISVTPKTTGSRSIRDHQEDTETATIFRGGLQATHSAAASAIEYAPLARKILDSLSFPVIHMREEEIAEAHKRTFEWIFSQKHFVDFLKLESGHFWISGKAGSGKSTLMKFLCSHERTEEALRC
ncbi:hypothetical protein EV356DRAFT_530447 [Viridothelium virens]|uniref:SET domain-containing protein n=1 Tax=Viridothelium virens TaxID=1048519 RepID=A0A6A6HGB4_VIRVR|nr:hypothetical protein EV356DRAFT_530447 [Viridothelium virens]